VATPLTLPLGEREVLAALRREAHPLTGDHRDYDALLALIGDARIVLLGEASHGTHEFYRERARITKRLIAEHGFTAVAIEGDWPDAHRVNRFVSGAGTDPDAQNALGGFRRFPTWMWPSTYSRPAAPAASSAACSWRSTRSRPASQKPGSARSTPTICPSSCGEREPPAASSSR
jgi:hypothetical protein